MTTRPVTQAGSAPERADLLRCLLNYQDLFDAIDANHPEGDVRHRYLGPRACRAQYVAWHVNKQVRAYNELCVAVKGNTNPEECWNRLDEVMIDLDKALTWYSRVYEEDSKAAQAPLVEQHFFDNYFREYMEPLGKERAPNGEQCTIYGSKGDPVSDSFLAPRGYDSSFFSRLVVDKLMIPFNQHIFVRGQQCYNWMLGRDTEDLPQGMSGRTLDILEGAMECTAATLCVAGAVTIMYNTSAMGTRLVIATLFSLLFPFLIVFMSKKAMHLFMLVAGFWAVTVAFCVATGQN